MTRREFGSLLGPSLLAQAPQRPNILLILADDLGLADLGCQGARDIRTPHIDGLARKGVRFTQAYANAPVCSPTRAALLTGRYQQRLGIEYVFYGERTRGKGLPPSEPSLAAYLRNAGYRTALAGKWHLGAEDEFSPNKHGFEEFFGLRTSDHDYYSHRTIDGTPDLWENLRRVERAGYSTELFGAWAADYIRRAGAEPFFLYAAFNAPHWPFQKPGAAGDVRRRGTWHDGSRADYAAMVESLDAQVGRMLGALEEAGKARNTLVIFTSDNGGERYSDNGAAFHRKFTLWEGGIRAPLLMRFPGRLPAGRECAQPATTLDLTATALSVAGAQARADRPLEGIDLLPVAAGRAPLRERTLFWRHRKQVRAVRHGDWKLLADGNYEMLFDLRTDPGERRDLSYRRPEIQADLRARLKAWEADVESSKPPFQVL